MNSSISSMMSSPASTTPPATGITAAETRTAAWSPTPPASRSSDSRRPCSASSRAASRALIVSASSAPSIRNCRQPNTLSPRFSTKTSDRIPTTIHAPGKNQRRGPARKRSRESAHRRPVGEGERGEEGDHDSEGNGDVPGRSPQLRRMASGCELSLPHRKEARRPPGLLDQLGHRRLDGIAGFVPTSPAAGVPTSRLRPPRPSH